MTLHCFFISLLLAGTCWAQSQTSGNSSQTLPAAVPSMTIPARTTVSIQGAGVFLEGAPYSGEQVYQSVQTLSDGGHITRPARPRTRTFRDSAGRTRTERPISLTIQNAAPQFLIIEIRDPVARVGYVLDTQRKVAHRFPLQSPQGLPLVRRATPAPANAVRTYEVSSTRVMSDGTETKTEYLGEQMIDGVLAEGRRNTTTYPKGYQGASAPIVATNENWTARGLEISILSKMNDPRTGETTVKWNDLKTIEPDPSLFQPPADYQIVDATGTSVTIEYQIQR